jgi:hypothetical protein
MENKITDSLLKVIEKYTPFLLKGKKKKEFKSKKI